MIIKRRLLVWQLIGIVILEMYLFVEIGGFINELIKSIYNNRLQVFLESRAGQLKGISYNNNIKAVVLLITGILLNVVLVNTLIRIKNRE